ncbi:hypothetical protein [Marinivivus vitaminiproducens]|uniref:hypothetical protein n=1 Tax=Marinivivus vitaminiproducens TaxID=3035935 RepID=UPI0027AB2EB2|nr:hypothetical protein P4R82_01690 [Geminicoccaceae bacterium SCSIO 64248]
MQRVRAITAALLVGLVAAGCSNQSGQTYSRSEVGRTVSTQQATVLSSRLVDIEGENSVIGPAAGAAAGAAGTGLLVTGGSQSLAAVLGGLVGAGAGALAERGFKRGSGIEYIVGMADGRTMTIVQNQDAGEVPIAAGTPVLVQLGGSYSRVIPDPRGYGTAPAPAASPDHGGTWTPATS